MCAEGHWIGFRRPLCGNPRPMISAAELSSRPVPPGSLRWEIFAPASQPLLPSPLLDDLVFLPWKICPRAPTKGPPRAGRFSLWGEMGGRQDLRRSAGRDLSWKEAAAWTVLLWAAFPSRRPGFADGTAYSIPCASRSFLCWFPSSGSSVSWRCTPCACPSLDFSHSE